MVRRLLHTKLFTLRFQGDDWRHSVQNVDQKNRSFTFLLFFVSCREQLMHPAISLRRPAHPGSPWALSRTAPSTCASS